MGLFCLYARSRFPVHQVSLDTDAHVTHPCSLDISGNRNLSNASLQALSEWHKDGGGTGGQGSGEVAGGGGGQGGAGAGEARGLPWESLHFTGTAFDMKGVLSLMSLDCLVRLESGECECGGSDLEELARRASRLQVLDLSWCEVVSDDAVLALSMRCSSLTSLNLRKTHVTDASLIALHLHAPQLRRLVLARCDGISDVGLDALCKGCRQLEDLDLSWLSDLSHEALLMRLPQLTNLKRLNLEGLKVIADAHLEAIGVAMRTLTRLYLTWCNEPSDAAIDKLVDDSTCGLIVFDYYQTPRSKTVDGGYQEIAVREGHNESNAYTLR